MEFTILSNGIKMPLVGYGTWTLRGKEGEKCISQAIEAGYRLIDTAKMYENEDIVGRAVSESGIARSEFFVTTKLNLPYDNFDKALFGIEDSLKLLKTDHIDLLLIHEPYENAPEMYKALEKAYFEKTVRAIGISNFSLSECENFYKHCEVQPMVNQVESHIFNSRLELNAFLSEKGTHMQAWSPLTQNKADLHTNKVLCSIGDKYAKKAASVALRYLVQKGISVIPKSSSFAHMKENIDIFGFNLTENEMHQISSLDMKTSLFGWDE